MPQPQFKLYPYRWVVLAVFMFINLTIQILWITYAPITGPAAQYYGVSDLQIGLLAMSFMIAFIPLSIPVSWLIDTYGFRLAVSIGAVMMGIFGIAPRAGRRQLHPGSLEHDRHRRRPALPAQRLDQGTRQLVFDPGARHRRRAGDALEPDRHRPGHAADAHPDRIPAHPHRAAHFWVGGGILGGALPASWRVRNRPRRPALPAWRCAP